MSRGIWSSDWRRRHRAALAPPHHATFSHRPDCARVAAGRLCRQQCAARRARGAQQGDGREAAFARAGRSADGRRHVCRGCEATAEAGASEHRPRAGRRHGRRAAVSGDGAGPRRVAAEPARPARAAAVGNDCRYCRAGVPGARLCPRGGRGAPPADARAGADHRRGGGQARGLRLRLGATRTRSFRCGRR